MTIWSAHAGDATRPEQISSEQILNALQPKPLTRGLSTARPDPPGVEQETRFLNGIRNRRTRSLSSEETLRRHLNTEPRDPRELNPKLDEDIVLVLKKSIEREVKARYASANAFKDALEKLSRKDY